MVEKNRRGLRRGDVVADAGGQRGVVVKIEPGRDAEDHGIIYVWQLDQTDYGADNCEHYPAFQWDRWLTVLDDSEPKELPRAQDPS